jgi:hypothetical protein
MRYPTCFAPYHLQIERRMDTLVQAGIEKGLIAFDADQKTIVYRVQNKNSASRPTARCGRAASAINPAVILTRFSWLLLMDYVRRNFMFLKSKKFAVIS